MAIKLYQPVFGKEEEKAVKRVLSSGTLAIGKEVERFEKRFAKYINVPYVIAVNSCTSAIYLSLLYQRSYTDLEKVKIPSVTYTSVASMILNAGLELEFIDEIFVGQAYYLVGSGIADSAHELYRNCFDDIESHIACYSFYPTKLLGGLEGGVIATDNKRAYEWLKMASRQGVKHGKYSWDYDVKLSGYKMHMNEMQAAILNVRLNKLASHNKRRKEIRDYYNEAFGIENESLHIYSIFVDKRDKLIDKMRSKNIECSVHFRPLHKMSRYKITDGRLPVSDWWGEHEVSIPLHENMSCSDVKRVIKEVKSYGRTVQKV